MIALTNALNGIASWVGCGLHEEEAVKSYYHLYYKNSVQTPRTEVLHSVRQVGRVYSTQLERFIRIDAHNTQWCCQTREHLTVMQSGLFFDIKGLYTAGATGDVVANMPRLLSAIPECAKIDAQLGIAAYGKLSRLLAS